MMAVVPYFSIIIPTKNRSHLIGNTLQSILKQPFDDYEIIVVDNDDTEATRQSVSQFSDARIRYFRTGGISMHDNWNHGIAQAQGQYLTILPDKQLYYRRALVRLHEHLREHQPQVATWLTDSLHDEEVTYTFSHLYKKPPTPATWNSSISLLERFLHDGYQGAHDLPKGSHSCIHRTLVEKIVQGPAQKLCHFVGTDTTLSFLQLAYVDSVLHIDEALSTVLWKETRGHNLNYMRKNMTPELRFFVDQGGGIERSYDLVPLKLWTLINNVHINDFLRMRSLVGGNLAALNPDPVRYFVMCYQEIAEREIGLRVDMREEERVWTATLRTQPSAIQNQVEQVIAQSRVNLQNTRRKAQFPFSWLQQARFRLGTLRHRLFAASPPPVTQQFSTTEDAIEWEAGQEYNRVFNPNTHMI
jgi:Glycosyl transferase family 2